MTDAAKVERQARRIRAEADALLADAETPRDARTIAEFAVSMADSVLFMLRENEHVTAAYCVGEAAGAIETAKRWFEFSKLWPDAKHGRNMAPGDTGKATDAHRVNAEHRKQKVIDLARVLLKDGHGRLNNNRINVRALAKECVTKGHFCPLGRDSAERVIREAVKAGKL